MVDDILTYSAYVFGHLNEENFFAEIQNFCQAWSFFILNMAGSLPEIFYFT